MTDSHTISTPTLSARIKADGAELTSLLDAGGDELLWQAGAEWPRHAPVLFPIVGRLPGDTLRHDGQTYRMTQHGFARDQSFEWLERSDSEARLLLRDSETTRAIYPFSFALELRYVAEGSTLRVETRVRNTGNVPLPYSVGAHPAFRWPLAPDVPKARHRLVFSARESGRSFTLDGGFLSGERDLPMEGRRLALSADLFAGDALVMHDVASRSVRFVALEPDDREERAIEVAWLGFRDLGVWSKPQGAPFLCIEPWSGTAPPMGWDDNFIRKPGGEILPPGEERSYLWSVTI